MASLELRNGVYTCRFSWQGKRPTITFGTIPEKQAKTRKGAVERLLAKLKRGDARVPDGVPIEVYVLHDGNPPLPEVESDLGPTLGELRDAYLDARKHGVEPDSLKTLRTHFRHLTKTFREDCRLGEITNVIAKKHIDRRIKCKGRHGTLNPDTIKKELTTFAAAWRWGLETKYHTVPAPVWSRLEVPKREAAIPFMVWKEAERLGTADAWDALFLRKHEVDALLAHLHEHAVRPWVYPAAVTAAHTGMRRAEIRRALVRDVDLVGGTLLVREKKRAKEKETFRRVPLSGVLVGVLTAWLKESKGRSPYLFSYRARGKRAYGQLTAKEANDRLIQSLANSRWQVLKGWHILRHSFISACVAHGIDQRQLDQWVGHTTSIRERYIHLAPSQQKASLDSVFGGGDNANS